MAATQAEGPKRVSDSAIIHTSMGDIHIKLFPVEYVFGGISVTLFVLPCAFLPGSTQALPFRLGMVLFLLVFYCPCFWMVS